MEEKILQDQGLIKKEERMDMNLIMKKMDYEKCFIKEVAVPKYEEEYDEEYGYSGYVLYEKIIVFDNNIFTLGFVDDDAKEVQQEIERLKIALLEEYEGVNVFQATKCPSCFVEFKNKEDEEEFYSPY